MIYRELSALVAVAAISLSFAPGVAVADSLDSAHNALCMRLAQTVSAVAADPDANDDVKGLFAEDVDRLCASPTSVFGDAPVNATGREKARACFRSLTVLTRDDLVGMDMPTPECGALFDHLQG